MTWFSVDVDIGDHPKMGALPSDAARYGWILSLAKAKKQRPAGTFATARHFMEVMGLRGKFLGDYLKVGLLDQNADGTLSVHDWRQYQYNASKQAKREDETETSRGHDVDTAWTESAPTDTGTYTETVEGSLEPPLSPPRRQRSQPTSVADILPNVVSR